VLRLERRKKEQGTENRRRQSLHVRGDYSRDRRSREGRPEGLRYRRVTTPRRM